MQIFDKVTFKDEKEKRRIVRRLFVRKFRFETKKGNGILTIKYGILQKSFSTYFYVYI